MPASSRRIAEAMQITGFWGTGLPVSPFLFFGSAKPLLLFRREREEMVSVVLPRAGAEKQTARSYFISSATMSVYAPGSSSGRPAISSAWLYSSFAYSSALGRSDSTAASIAATAGCFVLSSRIRSAFMGLGMSKLRKYFSISKLKPSPADMQAGCVRRRRDAFASLIRSPSISLTNCISSGFSSTLSSPSSSSSRSPSTMERKGFSSYFCSVCSTNSSASPVR